MYSAPTNPQVGTATNTGYAQGNMYAAPVNAQPAAGASVATGTTGKYTPNEQQLGEGIAFEPIIVTQQEEPIYVEGSKDGVGMAEGCARNPHIFTWILTLTMWFLVCSVVIPFVAAMDHI